MRELNIKDGDIGSELTIRVFDDGKISLFVLPYHSEWWYPIPLNKEDSEKVRQLIQDKVAK